MIQSDEIQALFERHALDGPVPNGLTLKKIVQDSAYGPIKLRAFPDSSTAEERLYYLDVCRQAGIQVPAVLGAHDRYVVFDYKPVEKAAPNSKSYREVGRFLGTLNSIPTEPLNPEEFFSEVAIWLENINQENILPRSLTSHILKQLNILLPVDIKTGIDYWDAMPHNFGWHDDTFFLLDEKHTRHSFCGVGLAKPMLVLSKTEWADVRSGYNQTADLETFDQNVPFLVYYYLLAALYFYSLISAADRIDPSVNTRLHQYRQMLLEKTAKLTIIRRLMADLHFVFSHPRSLPLILRQKLRSKEYNNSAT